MRYSDTGPDTGDDPLVQPRDIAVALSLLTRLPLRLPDAAYARGARTAWAWPLVGLLLALPASALATLAQTAGIPPQISVLLALAMIVIATGAMHEDGLADVADGFWGGHDPARRLEIMKDSRIGAYGVIALVLSLALRGTILVALADTLFVALAASAMLSRAAMAHVMQTLPNARGDGLSHSTGRPGFQAVWIAAGLALAGTLASTGWAAIWAILAAAAAALACRAIARARIGGQTGDVLGATQQISEIAVLLALSAAL